MAFRRVDLPALTLPAMATRSGSPIRRSTAAISGSTSVPAHATRAEASKTLTRSTNEPSAATSGGAGRAGSDIACDQRDRFFVEPGDAGEVPPDPLLHVGVVDGFPRG